jgi:ankyrin repeat protein
MTIVFAMLLAGLAAAADARLAVAVKTGDAAAVQALLKQRVDVNAPEVDGTTALHWAVRNDDSELVDRLIRAGANAKAANRYGITPLYLGAVNGNAGIIEKLLKAGAAANAVVNEGETALMTAARTGSVEAVKVLLAHGADVNAQESWHGETALMWAVSERHAAVARELLAKGALVNGRSAVNKWERQNTAEPREKWLPLGGLPVLSFAAREGCVECVPVLLDAGAEINAADQDGITALLMAMINGHYDVAGVLLERGADPNIADRTGRTPLYSAVDFHTMPESNRPSPKEIGNELSSLDVLQRVLAKGANVNTQLKQQQPYRTKLDRGDDTMLTTGTTPFLRAAKAGDTTAMKLLLEQGADAKLATRNGINPLMAAAGLGTKEEDTTGRRKTQADAIAAIKLCLEAGVDINAVDNRGQSALHGAAFWGLDEVVQFLVDRGAKLDVKDKQGRTPLDAAMGLAGGVGFDGQSSVPRPSTTALIQKLLAARN